MKLLSFINVDHIECIDFDFIRLNEVRHLIFNDLARFLSFA